MKVTDALLAIAVAGVAGAAVAYALACYHLIQFLAGAP